MTRKKYNSDCVKKPIWLNFIVSVALIKTIQSRLLGFEDDPLGYLEDEFHSAENEIEEIANDLSNSAQEEEQGMEDWLSQTQHEAQEQLDSLNQAAEDKVNSVETEVEQDVTSFEKNVGDAFKSTSQSLFGGSGSQAQTSDESVLTIDQLTDVIELSGEPQNQKRYYSLKLRNRDENDNLIVKLLTDDPFSDPDIFISFSEKRPDSSSNSDFYCSSEGRDTCTVSLSFIKEHLHSDQKVYIGVKCSNQCRYRLHSQLVPTIVLTDNTELQIEIKSGESKLFRVHVPSASELGGLSEDRISSLTILAAPLIQAAYDASNDFTLSATAKQGMTPGSDSTHSIQGTSVWANGKAIHLSESENLAYSIDNQWCTDCYITILLSVLAEGRYTIISKANVGNNQRIFEDTPLYGVAKAGERVCYKYHIKDAKKNVDVRFKLYSGASNQSIDPLEAPKTWDESEFKISGTFDSEYVLTPRMRKKTSKGDQQSGLYYICNFAHTYSSFSILLKEVPVDQQFTMLENGFQYSDELPLDRSVAPIKHYLYKVPKLDFGDEDIKLRFQMEVSQGAVPRMAVKYCNSYQSETQAQAKKRCSDEITSLSAQDVIARASSQSDEQKFEWATQGQSTPIVFYEYDHDESSCNTIKDGRQEESKCFYQIMVIGQVSDSDDSTVTRYKLSANKFQQNKQILRGSLPKVATVGMDEVRWFQYTLSDASSIQKISFQLKTYHGDADLFVSKTNEYPEGLDDNDKTSQKTRGLIDRVDFGKDDSDLVGVYYIGVVGYQESSFELKCVHQRNDQSEWDVMEGNSLDRYYQLLYDGYPTVGLLHNELAVDRYRIEVNMEPGFEKAIVIDVIDEDVDNHVMVFISYRRDPSQEEGGSDFSVMDPGSKQIRIEVGSEYYHSKGTYYIFVAPIQNSIIDEIWHFFTDDYYHYTIKYTLEGSFEFLNYDLLTQSQQEQGSVSKYRYIVADPSITQKVNLNIYEGSVFVKASLNKDDVQKMSDESGSSNGILPIRTGQGFTRVFDQTDFQDPQNEQCQNEINSCVIYIGVVCLSTETLCKYSLKISDENSGPEKILVGSPIQSSVDEYQLNYYYISVTEKHVIDQQPIFVVLNTQVGDSDLYIKLQTNSNLIKKSKWELPTTMLFDYKSEETMNRDMIQVSSSSLQKCIEKSKSSEVFKNLSNEGEQAECAVLIGVHGKNGRGLSQYDLVSYVNIQILLSERSVYSIVEEGMYQYYIYEVNCDDCEFIIGIQDYTGGDPDLYINYGQRALPDKDDYHFKSTSYASETFILNLDDPYFAKNKLTSMKGYYTIGVFGKKRSTYILTATQNEARLVMLEKGVPLRYSQEPYETTFYRWYNPQIGENRDDIKVNVKVIQGKVDVYVNTYDDFDETDIVDKLPDSSRKSFYQLKNLKPTAQLGESEILVHSADQDYCQQCWYLIGVHTKDVQTDYEIKLSQMIANFENSHFIKMGTPQSDSIPPNHAALYKFIIDTKSAVTISQQVTQGAVELYIGNEGIPTAGNKIAQISNTDSVTFNPQDESFDTAVMYSILAVNNGQDTAYSTISITQKQSVLDIQDGVPWKVLFTDSEDISKNFAMKLPKGKHTLTLQIQPVVAASNYKFQPFLYYKLVDNLGEKIDQIDFPPSGTDGFAMKRTYEGNGFLQVTKIVEVDNDDAGIVFTVYMQPNRRHKDDESAHEVMVFASTQQEQLLIENQQYLETLFDNQQVVYLKLDEGFNRKNGGFTYIEVATCLGSQKIKFLKDTENSQSLIVPNQNYKDKVRGRTVSRFKNPIDKSGFYVEVQAVDMTDPGLAFRDGNGQRSQFMIKAFYSNTPVDNSEQMFKPVSPEITWTQSQSSENVVNLKWYTLINHTPGSDLVLPEDDVQYYIFMTTDMAANLDSECILNSDVQIANKYQKSLSSKNERDVAVRPGQTYKINVVADIYQGEFQGNHFIYQSFILKAEGILQDEDAKTSQDDQILQMINHKFQENRKSPNFKWEVLALCCCFIWCCNLKENRDTYIVAFGVCYEKIEDKICDLRGIPRPNRSASSVTRINGIPASGQELAEYRYNVQQLSERSSDFDSSFDQRTDAVVATNSSDENKISSN